MPKSLQKQFLDYLTQFLELEQKLISVSILFSIRNKMVTVW